MTIIFPPLVEQSFRYFQEATGETFEKSELYCAMVENHIITETGFPTLEAIEKGWIKDFYEEENLSFEKFLEIYPIFKKYNPALFQRVEGFWEIPITFQEELRLILSSGQLMYDEVLQVEEYLADR